MLPVSDARSNPNDQIAHAANVIRGAPQRMTVFKAIHSGRVRIKSASELAVASGLPRKRVVEEAIKLIKQHIVARAKKNGEIAYERDDFYSAHRDRIIRQATDKEARAKFPTKYNRPTGASSTVVFRLPKRFVDTRFVTVDELDSFKRVRRIRKQQQRLALAERRFKRGLQGVLGDYGVFTDWGGEQNDLLSTGLRVKLGGRRLRVAFGLKGPGMTGKLTPKKMGKNGDQIPRLFKSPADVFFVQYWDQIDESVLGLMADLAKARSVSEGGTRVWWGIIDGWDSDRLARAYPKEFGLTTRGAEAWRKSNRRQGGRRR